MQYFFFATDANNFGQPVESDLLKCIANEF